jgi:hypothetical protein
VTLLRHTLLSETIIIHKIRTKGTLKCGNDTCVFKERDTKKLKVAQMEFSVIFSGNYKVGQ